MWHALLCVTLGATVGGSVVTAPYMTVSPFRQVENVLPKLVERRQKLDAEAAAAYALQMTEASEVQAAMGAGAEAESDA